MRSHRGCTRLYVSELLSTCEMSYRSSVVLISHMNFASLISHDDISPTSLTSMDLSDGGYMGGGFNLGMNYYMCKTFLALKSSQITS